ncbi:MAG: hypothetical protein JSW00_10445 [Thermoplasmata archaeon]|nr:MAG: hypothetical protein JSW00_10445 [Thermoplasmata archaeon]
MKNVMSRYTRYSLASVMAFAMIVGMFSTISFVDNAKAHVAEGEGHPLQLYSYFFNNDTVNIDGDIANDAGFWARAYARNVTFRSNELPAETIPVSMFFVNSNSYLYIALAWDAGNNGANNGVWLFLDEGDNAGSISDGSHLDGLTNPSGERNEDGVYRNKNDGSGRDLNWNNAGSVWADDVDTTDKVMDVDNFGNGPYFNAEFRIPLSRENDDIDDSNLDIIGTDEIGIYIIVHVVGGGVTVEPGHYYWDVTTVQPGNKNLGGDYEPLAADATTNQWGDLKLGLMRDETKLYSTVNINGAPAVDGDISNDIAWINSYKREMKFTNFHGTTMEVKFYSVQDQTSKNIWCGFRVEDDDFNGNDEFYIYQERETAPDPGNNRNFLLDTNFENLVYVVVGGTWEDWEYDGGTWNIDDDDQTALGAVQYFPSPTPRYEFEFEIPYNGGNEDLNMLDNGLFGFFMKFIDSDMPAGEQEFFWEMTANDELIRLNEPDDVHVSVGWVDLQMGGPAVSPVQPDDGGMVSGIDFRFRIYAEDEPPNGIDFITFTAFKTEKMDTFKNLFREPGTGFWSTYWDTTAEDNGPTRVTIVAQDDEGITVYIYINVMISNAGAGGNPPSGVEITDPAVGPLTGPELIEATALGASYVEFYVDGELFSVDITSPYQASLDTTLYADGGHIVSIRAVNIAGETWDAMVYEFDNWDLNTLSITDPITGTSQNGSINVVGDFVADNSGEYAELYVDDMFWSFSDDTATGAVTFELDTELLSEGAHQVKMFVYDPEGNKLMDMVTIYVDNIEPGTPTIASLIDGQYIDGTFVFKVQCDTSDLASVELTIPTVITDMPIGYNSASGYYEYTLDTTALTDGDYSVSAVSWDTAGSSASSGTVNFKIDNTAPTLAVSSPLDNAIVSGIVEFNYTATDTYLSSVMYKIDGNSWVDIDTDWDTRTFNDGEHMVSIKAADESGHYTMITLDLVVDNNAPEIAILNPVNNQFLSDDFTFRIRAEDMVGLSDVRITITNTDSAETVVDDISIILNEVSGHYEYTLDTMTLADGNYSITATSYDISGKDSGASTVNFMVDNNAPKLMLTAPLNGELLTGSVAIDVDYSDVFLVDMVYRIDGGAWVDLSTAWDTSLVNDGAHTIDIKLTDKAGHMATQTVSVKTDNTAPDLYPVYWPTENVASSFHIQMYAMDAVELVEVTYQINNLTSVRMFENKAIGFYEAEIVVDSSGLGLPDGDHELKIMATDSVDLSTQISTTITVDNTGPTITISEPAKGKTVEGDVKFIVELTDATGIDVVQIRIDKGEWIDMKEEDGKYVYNWNSRKAYNGKYDVDVKAVDTLGNEAVGSSEIKVDNFPMLAFLVFIVILVILVVLMVISWSKGPKKEKPAKIEEPSVSPVEEETEVIEGFACPECGANVGPGDSSCPQCGVELEGHEEEKEEEIVAPPLTDLSTPEEMSDDDASKLDIPKTEEEI